MFVSKSVPREDAWPLDVTRVWIVSVRTFRGVSSDQKRASSYFINETAISKMKPFISKMKPECVAIELAEKNCRTCLTPKALANLIWRRPHSHRNGHSQLESRRFNKSLPYWELAEETLGQESGMYLIVRNEFCLFLHALKLYYLPRSYVFLSMVGSLS